MNKKNNRKSPSFSLSMIFLPFLFISVFVGSLVAYAAATAREEKVDLLQVGNLETKVVDDGHSPVSSIKLGQAENKSVQIENRGTINQFVRVMIVPEIETTAVGVSTQRVLASGIGTVLSMDLDTSKWKDGKDGYYYYLEAVKADKKTTKLFTSIKLPSGLSEEYIDAKIRMRTKVEAIACGGKKSSNYGVYQDAWWNGEKPTSGALKDINDALQQHVEE